MYRIGFPGWKLAAQMGVPLSLCVDVHFDHEAMVYWAASPDLDGLVVEGATLDELRTEVRAAAEMLLELAVSGKHAKATPVMRFQDEALSVA